MLWQIATIFRPANMKSQFTLDLLIARFRSCFRRFKYRSRRTKQRGYTSAVVRFLRGIPIPPLIMLLSKQLSDRPRAMSYGRNSDRIAVLIGKAYAIVADS